MAPQTPPVKGLRIDVGLQFDFKPSIGLNAKALDKLGLDIRSFREPLKRSIQQVLAPSFKKNFQAGGRPDKWVPLAPQTVAMRGGATGPILVRTGRLRDTIQQFNIWSVNDTQAAITSLPDKIKYGNVHQEGLTGEAAMKQAMKGMHKRRVAPSGPGSKPKRSGSAAEIPARPFVMIQDEDYDAIQNVFEKWFLERMAASGAYKISGV